MFFAYYIQHTAVSLPNVLNHPLWITPWQIPFREFIPLTNLHLTCVTYLCLYEHGAASDASTSNNQGSNTNRARLPRDVMYPHDRESMPCRGLPHLHLHASCQNKISPQPCVAWHGGIARGPMKHADYFYKGSAYVGGGRL
jgi:hypothetical protein